ncbi:hypothetical protein D3C87_1653000 [compost metagenome]
MPSMPTSPPAQSGLALRTSRELGSQLSSLKGPEPIVSVPMVPAVISLAGTTAALMPAMATRIGTSAVERLKTTVSASGVSMLAIERKFERATAAVASSRMRSNEAFTSAEVTWAPLVNLALGSSLKVSVLASAENSQLEAMAGMTLRSASKRTSGS